ncbi:RING-H2 finger protein ATL29 [Spinacia oleracea]|uniref:RING-type E3 ubiquitin transferase n=1 Tax=Spinacia oleracea TaxID=3562 RepID=A0A9R0IM92_SPIOL|nr:RING-H2 finger protein ATL29-like [Spinacia oleracea]
MQKAEAGGPLSRPITKPYIINTPMSMTESPLPDPQFPQDPTPPVTLVLTILLLVMFFVGFFSIYFCRCFLENIVNSLNNRQTPNGTPINPNTTTTTLTPPGLDLTIVNSFPTFTYSSVKDYRREKYGLECAICLCEFDDDDILRLLTSCCHVFHRECIDLWFELHKSCPVCRRNLDTLEMEKSPEKLPYNRSIRRNGSIGNNNVDHDIIEENTSSLDTNNNNHNHNNHNDAISIVIKEDYDANDNKKNSEDCALKCVKFARSHTTGHSIFRDRAPREEADKYTLRIPDHVKELIKRRHRHKVTLSCTTFEEVSCKTSRTRHEGFGEISAFENKGDGPLLD